MSYFQSFLMTVVYVMMLAIVVGAVFGMVYLLKDLPAWSVFPAITFCALWVIVHKGMI